MKLKDWADLPRVAGLLALVTTLALLLNTRIAVAGGLPDLGIDLSSAQRLDDSELGQLRGRFAINGQPVLFFGLVMQSSLGLPGALLSAGAAFGVDLSGPTPTTITDLTWTRQSAPGLSGTPGGGSGPLSNLSGGIGQVVQIAGQGNTGANVATIDVTTSAPDFVPPTVPGGASCDELCQAKITANGIQVMVTMPGLGSVTQTINPQSILQDIMLNGNLAQALNSLQLFVQVGQLNPDIGVGLNALQSIPTLPH